MVKINNSEEYMTVNINEAIKEIEGEWKKILVLRFPTAEDFTVEQARGIAANAQTVEHVEKDKVKTYFVSGIVEEKIGDYFSDFWLLNPEIEIEDNLLTKLEEMEIVLENLLGGEEE